MSSQLNVAHCLGSTKQVPQPIASSCNTKCRLASRDRWCSCHRMASTPSPFGYPISIFRGHSAALEESSLTSLCVDAAFGGVVGDGEAFGGVRGCTMMRSLTSGSLILSPPLKSEFGSPAGAAVEMKASFGGVPDLPPLIVAPNLPDQNETYILNQHLETWPSKGTDKSISHRKGSSEKIHQLKGGAVVFGSPGYVMWSLLGGNHDVYRQFMK